MSSKMLLLSRFLEGIVQSTEKQLVLQANVRVGIGCETTRHKLFLGFAHNTAIILALHKRDTELVLR